jgi:hypothetical protein
MSRNAHPVRRNTANRPPMFESNLRVRHRFRFQTPAGFNGVISSADIMAACGNICDVTNSSVIAIFDSFRIHTVEVWSSPAIAMGANVTCSLEWLGTGQAPAIEVSDTSNSVTTPARLRCGPPRESNAAFWQTPRIASTNMFTLVSPYGTIVDMVLDLVMADVVGATPLLTNVTTATLGNIYYLALDGPASNQLRPVSLNTTS